MKVKALSIWFSVTLITTSTLCLTWYDAHYLNVHNVAIVKQLLLLNRQNLGGKNVAILGSSLVANAFAGDAQLTHWLKKQNINVNIHRYTILAASASELEMALINILASDAQVIIVEITPWLVSLGFGEKMTNHRHWINTLLAKQLSITPYRYDQNIFIDINQGGSNYSNDGDKFINFTPKKHQLSLRTQTAIKNSSAKILFYLTSWGQEAYANFGIAKTKQLKINASIFAQDYKVTLLTSPPSLPNNYYKDLAHVNDKGRQVYMQWLKNTLVAQP